MMGRIRTIKPEFPHSETTGELSRDARLLFILIWTIADDEGRARASSRLLASLLFPYDDDAPSLIAGWLNELEEFKCIQRYTVDDDQYLEVTNWLKHQKIDHPTRSKLPPNSHEFSIARESSRKLAPDLGPSTKDLGSKEEDSCAPAVRERWSFENFWTAYPKKKAKKAAERAFRKVEREGEVSLDGLLAAISTITKDEKFIPYPASWLNAGGYLDGQPAAPKPQNELSYEELRAQWLAKQEKGNGERAEVGKTSSVVETKFGDRKGNGELGGDQTWLPRIHRMDEVFSKGNGPDTAVYGGSDFHQKGSDVAESLAKSKGTA
jgi:hypothetical protein